MPPYPDRQAWSAVRKILWSALATTFGPLWIYATWLRLRGSAHLLQDLAQEWLSARNVLTGRPAYLPLSESIRLHLGAGWQPGLIDVNAHPPGSMLLALPLGWLDYPAAWAVWTALSVLALIAAFGWLMGRRGLGLPPWAALPVFTLVVTSNALAQQLNQGQWNALLLLVLVAAWRAARQGKETLAGGLIGWAAALKLFPAFLFLWLAASRRWRGLAAALGVALGWNVLAAGILGRGAFHDYATDVLPRLGRFRDFWPNASLAGWWSKLFEGASGHVEPLVRASWMARAGTALCVAALAVAVIVATRRAGDGRAAIDRTFALAVVAALLASPLVWDHYFLLLGLPLLVLWRGSPAGAWRRRLAVVAALGLGTLNPAWLYRLAIPGPGELAYLHGLEPSVATPLHAVTVLSVQLYLLLAVAWALAIPDGGRLRGRPPRRDPQGRGSPPPAEATLQRRHPDADP